jgi:hypothetical protein
MYDVADAAPLPSFVREDAGLRAVFERHVREATSRSEEQFEGLGISSRRVASADGVIPGIFRLLESHNHARR